MPLTDNDYDFRNGVFTTDYGRTGPSTNPFENAANYLGVNETDSVTKFVQDQVDFAKDLIDQTDNIILGSEGESGIINDLTKVQLIIPDTLAPPLPELDYDFTPEEWIGFDDPPGFGTIPNYDVGPAPKYTGDTSITVPPIPSFNPSYTSFYIPPPGDYNPPPDPGNPPEVTSPDFPPDPVLDAVPVPGFTPIVLPKTPVIEVPEFSAIYPTFDDLPPPVQIEWTEPAYTETIIDKTIAQIETFLEGGTGIRPDVQDLMYNLAAEREDRIAVQSIQEVIDEYAARGYSLPPGLLSKRISSIRFDRDLKKQGINREVLIKAMDAEIENLRFAVAEGRQAEQLYIQLFLAAQDRAFQALRLSVEYALQVYGFSIELFRAKQEEVRTRATVYEVQVRAALIEIEIYKAQIEGELAKVEVNKAQVDLYEARIEANKTLVEQYEIQVRAEATKLEAIRIEVQAFGEKVNAYAAQVQGEKIRFDAYDSYVRGELGKAQIVESEARAYGSEVAAIGTTVNAEARALEAGIGAFTAGIQGYIAETNAARDEANVQLAGIQANVAGYQAGTQRYIADSERQEALARVELAAWNAGLEGQLGYYRVQIAKYQIDAQLLTEQSRIYASALESAGGLGTTIIGGALAAMHIGATISGSGSISATGSLSEAYQNQQSLSDSMNVSDAIGQEVRYNIAIDGGTGSPPEQPPWGTASEGQNN